MLSGLSFNRVKWINLILLLLIFCFAFLPVEKNELASAGQGQVGQDVKAASASQGTSQEQVIQQQSNLQPASVSLEPTISGKASEQPASTSAVKPSMEAEADAKVEEAGTQDQTGLASILHIDANDFDTMEVTATGYYAGPESTGKSVGHPEYGITYSGVKVRRATVSTIAADPKVLPIGSLLYIPDYGYGVVADTGSAIKGNKIDLYFETKQAVYRQWGKRKVKVLVLKKGDGKVTESMLNRWNRAFAQLKNAPTVM